MDGWTDPLIEMRFRPMHLKTRPTPYSCVQLLRPLNQKTKRLKDQKTKRPKDKIEEGYNKIHPNKNVIQSFLVVPCSLRVTLSSQKKFTKILARKFFLQKVSFSLKYADFANVTPSLIFL